MGALGRVADRLSRTSGDPDFGLTRGAFKLVKASPKVAAIGLKYAAKGAVKSAKFGGAMALGAAGNFASGHWNESGLANLFGPLKTLTGSKKAKKLKKKLKNGLKQKSSASKSGNSSAFSALSKSIDNLTAAQSSQGQSLKDIHSSIVKMDDNMKKGFVGLYQLISGMSSKKDPFSDIANRRKHLEGPKPSSIKTDPKKGGGIGSILAGLAGLLGKLFGGNGKIMSGLTSILGVAKGLLKVVGALSKGIGKVLKFAGSLAGTLIKNLGKAVAAAGLALGRAARAVFNRFRGRPGGRAPRPPRANVEPSRPTETPRPNPEAEPRPNGEPEARPRPNGEPEPNRPRANGEPEARPNGEPEGTRARPNAEPEARPNATEPEARPNATETNANRALNNAERTVNNAEANARPQVEGRPTEAPVEPPKPAPTSTPSGTSTAAEAATETSVKEAVEAGAKAVAKSKLTGVLSKVGGAALVAAFEGVNGFAQWSDAYDKWKKGEINEGEFKKEQRKIIAGAVAGTAGALGGMAIGAGIGSAILPGIGTVVGGLVGGYLGTEAAHAATDKVMDGLDKTVWREDGTGQPAGNNNNAAPNVQGQPAATPNRNLEAAPGTRAAAERMNAGTERQAARNRAAPTIVNAPTTNNNVTNNNGGSGGGSGNASSPGSARPSTNPLDQRVLGDFVGP